MINYEMRHQTKKKTQKRILKMKQEFSKPPQLKLFENTEGYDQMIAQVGIPITALCEHHEVQFYGKVYIAYVPKNWLIGLSKLARVTEYFLNPTIKTIQERATHQILKYLEKHLKPSGIMVVIKATHGCISYRGIKKPSLTITSAVSGSFAEPQRGLKIEFLNLINNHDE